MQHRHYHARRPTLVLTALAFLGSGALAACGGSSPSTAASSDCSTLSVAVRSQTAINMKAAVAAYEKENPNQKVSLQTLPDNNAQYLQRIVTQRLGKDMPDVVENIDVLVGSMAASKVTENLVPFFKKQQDFTAASFLPQFLGAYRPLDLPDEIHGMPVGADAYVLYYNKAVFKKYKVALPTDNWTWDDFLAASKKITTAGNGKDFGTVPPGQKQPLFNPVIQSFGGYVYNKDTKKIGIGEPEAIKAWKFLLKPYQDGTYAPFAIDMSPSAPGFESGHVAMAFSTRKSTTTFRNQLKSDWDVVPMPTLNGKHTIGGGSYGLSMSHTSQCKDQAWGFLKWFFSTDGGMKVFQENYTTIPATKDGIDGGLWRELPGPPNNVDAFAQSDKEAIMAPQLPRAAGDVLTSSILTAQQKVLLQGDSVEDAFGAAAKEVQAALDTGK